MQWACVAIMEYHDSQFKEKTPLIWAEENLGLVKLWAHIFSHFCSTSLTDATLKMFQKQWHLVFSRESQMSNSKNSANIEYFCDLPTKLQTHSDWI